MVYGSKSWTGHSISGKRKMERIAFVHHGRTELEALRPLEADGLVEVSEDVIRVTARGRFLLRPIAMTFDEYLPAERQSGRFSKVI